MSKAVDEFNKRREEAEKKFKKDQEAVKNSVYRPVQQKKSVKQTPSNMSLAGKRSNSTRVYNSYDWETREMREATKRNSMHNQYREEGKAKYDEENGKTKSNMSRMDRIRENNRKKLEGYGTAAHREILKRNAFANDYANRKTKENYKDNFVNEYREADRKWKEYQKKHNMSR